MTPKDVALKPLSIAFFNRLGFGATVEVSFALIFWSIAAPIDSAVLAVGRVVVETNRKTIQHLEGGMVGEVLVREGDLVSQGQVMVRLDDTVPRANASLIDGQLVELYARRARLESERDSRSDLGAVRGAEEILATSAFKEKLTGQRMLFDARQTTLVTQSALLQEKIVQQQERIIGIRAQLRSLRNQLRLIQDELNGVRELHAQGYAPATRVRALERELERITGERGSLEAGIAEAESAIASAKLEIERLIEDRREQAITELREVEVKISELEERRIAAVDALRRTEIRAPQSGRVLGLAVHTVGEVTGPGESLMEIIPDGDKLFVDARIATRDVDKVRQDQETLVRFSGLGSRNTPEVQGTVINVSADSIVDDSTGAAFYVVRIEIPEGEVLSKELNGETLVPGMPVEAFIRTGSRPAISYLLKPLTDSMTRSFREE